MSDNYTGACACGAVHISIAGDVSGPYQCFCRQCQRASGGGPATFVMVPQDAVTVEGNVNAFEEPTASGNQASRSFCANCGTAVFSQPAKSAGTLAVKLSMIENAPWDSVKAAFWTSEKPAWFKIPDDVRQFEMQP